MQNDVNLTSLNVRLSNRSIHPPPSFIKGSFRLGEIQAATARVGPTPQSAILEDDHRNRVAVLTREENGHLTAYVLQELDLDSKIPDLIHCAEQRHCAIDRRPITGGLGCVAICLQEILDPGLQP